jgi:AcrR family transcriptional regulator
MIKSSGPGPRATSRTAQTPLFLHPDVRRRQILEAAVEVFGEKGFAATRIADIAARAGVAHGTIYRYFRNKDDLAKALFEAGGNAAIKKLQAMRSDGSKSSREIFTEYVRWNADYQVRYHKLIVALFSWVTDPLMLRDHSFMLLDELAAELSPLLEDIGYKSLPAGDPARVLMMLSYGLSALSFLYLRQDEHPDKALAGLLMAAIERVFA